MASHAPDIASSASGTGIARENRRSGASPGGDARSVAINGSSDPTQNVTQTACTNTAGRLTMRGAALLAWPLSASARPTPTSATSESARAMRGVGAANENSAANSAKAAAIAVRP